MLKRLLDFLGFTQTTYPPAPRPPIPGAVVEHLESKRITLDVYKGLKPLCSGEGTGCQCVHYWTLVHPSEAVRSADDNTVRRRRLCTYLDDPDDLGVGGAEMPVHCNRYEASTRLYDKTFEEAVPNADTGPASMGPPSIETMIASAVAGLKADAMRVLNGEAPQMYPPLPPERDADGLVHWHNWGNRTVCGKVIMPLWTIAEIYAETMDPRFVILEGETRYNPELRALVPQYGNDAAAILVTMNRSIVTCPVCERAGAEVQDKNRLSQMKDAWDGYPRSNKRFSSWETALTYMREEMAANERQEEVARAVMDEPDAPPASGSIEDVARDMAGDNKKDKGHNF